MLVNYFRSATKISGLIHLYKLTFGPEVDPTSWDQVSIYCRGAKNDLKSIFGVSSDREYSQPLCLQVENTLISPTHV